MQNEKKKLVRGKTPVYEVIWYADFNAIKHDWKIWVKKKDLGKKSVDTLLLFDFIQNMTKNKTYYHIIHRAKDQAKKSRKKIRQLETERQITGFVSFI